MNRVIAKKTRGVALSLILFVAAAITGAWALGQFRTDWAPVAVLGVPGEAALAGFLALAFTQWRDAPIRYRRILAWVGLAASALIAVFNVALGIPNLAANRAAQYMRPINYADPTKGVWVETMEIAFAVKQNPEHRERWLDSSVRARLRDSVFLSAAVNYDFISPQLLDTLAGSAFERVALGAIVNPGTSAETLAKTYETRSGSDPVVRALAQNRHTPPDILRKIYSRSHNPIVTEIALAANPSTPRDVLQSLARSPRHPETIHALLGNQVIDCTLFSDIESYLVGKERSGARDYNIARMNEVRPKVCSNSTVK